MKYLSEIIGKAQFRKDEAIKELDNFIVKDLVSHVDLSKSIDPLNLPV